jgi:hypothetical protein
VKEFLDAAEQHEADFTLLRREGILPPIGDFEPDKTHDIAAESVFQHMLVQAIIREQLIRKLVRSNKLPASALELCGRNQAMRNCSPSAWHALHEQCTALYQDAPPKLKKYIKPELLERLIFDMYLKMLVEIADHQGVAIMTYSQAVERSIQEVRHYPSILDANASKANQKALADQIRVQTAATKLGQKLLTRTLPRVHDLPMEDVLELRQKHKDEIKAFRVGLGEIAAAIDRTQPSEQDLVEINQLIMTRVDPALADLRAGLKNSQLNAFEGLSKSGAAWTPGGVGAVITYVATGGTQNALSGLVGLLIPVIGAMLSGHLEKRRLMNASRWSLLIKLEEKSEG